MELTYILVAPPLVLALNLWAFWPTKSNDVEVVDHA